MMKVLDDVAQTYQVVLTKTDKLSEHELEEVTGAVGSSIRSHVAAHPELIMTSAETKDGIERLRGIIAELM